MADFKPKPRDKNLLDSKRITLSTPCPVNGVKGWSTLYFYANNDNPGITVYTGDPNDKDNNFGRIQAKFGIGDMRTLLEVMDLVIRSKDAMKADCTCKSIRGQDKKQVDVARVEIGKKPDGVMYIMVEDLERQGRPKIYFPFAPTRFHTFRINNEPVTEAQISCLVARGMYNLIGDLITQISRETYKHPEPKQNGGGGGNWKNNGNNNRSGGGGGYSSNSGGGSESGGYSGGSDYEDDIPF